MVILSPTFMAWSSYPIIQILNVGEPISGPPATMALEIFDMSLGKILHLVLWRRKMPSYLDQMEFAAFWGMTCDHLDQQI